ncbi:unnamed protein product [Candida verbasci]|uniref:Dipeptidyl aminopeptidase A n=1 Tax=Candida verbasci TaxID=1227364 RepID=A0A9W4TSJ4_9ASCO|nr:unnamed protein product [Candida verbasci]
MFSRVKDQDEEYEMVEALGPRQQSSNESMSTPASSRSSTDSTISNVFEDIEYNAIGKENFNLDPIYQTIYDRYKKQPFNSKLCGIFALLSVILWVAGVLVYSKSSPHELLSILNWQTNVNFNGQNITLNAYNPNFANLSLHSIMEGRYQPDIKMIRWLNKEQYPKGAEDGGYYLAYEDEQYKIQQLDTNFEDVFINVRRFMYQNDFFNLENIILNPSKSVEELNNHHIIITDSITQWRHSKFSLYWIYNPITSTYKPIQPPKNEEKLEHAKPFETEVLDKLHFAEFSPSGNYIVFGFEHNLFLLDLKSDKLTQITNDGSSNIFNGKPDWVYEEEVMPTDKSIWWSPDEKYMIFTKINDTKVEEFELEYYIKTNTEIGTLYEQSNEEKFQSVNQYPIKTSIKYPKPGLNNPIISLHAFNLENQLLEDIKDSDKSLGDDYIMYQGTWLDNSNFLIKETDRTSSVLSKKIYQPGQKVKVLNSINVTNEYGGWVEKMKAICVLEDGKYIDIIVKDYKVQLALFDNPSAIEPSKILAADVRNEATYDKIGNFIYFQSSSKSSMESHLVAINLSNYEIFNLTDLEAGYYETQFSKDAQYLNLIYEGPNQPYQKLINVASISHHLKSGHLDEVKDIIKNSPIINNVDYLSTKVKNTNLPTVLYEEVKIEKDNIFNNVKVILPPNFNPEKKYPLLVHSYGGPGSQTVKQTFSIDFVNSVSANLNTIVLVIEPRGTEKDWKYKSFANNKIGYWEPRDITLITSEFISKHKFVSKDKVAIWGWSYGGFTTLKTLEYDKGKTFKYGLAVAPVTNWLFYDSIYTERYMNKPNDNPNYKQFARINDIESFKSIKRFLIMTGSADDNVNFQNTMWLINKFNLNNVENYDMMIFPDSDHGIYYNNADIIIYDKLFNWLHNAFNGKFVNGFL